MTIIWLIGDNIVGLYNCLDVDFLLEEVVEYFVGYLVSVVGSRLGKVKGSAMQ